MAFGCGPVPAKIMLVGEVFGREETKTGQPFSGESGKELNRMLHEAGIMRSELYTTNVINAQPPYGKIEKWIPLKKADVGPQHSATVKGRWVAPEVAEGFASLQRELDLVKPNLVIAAGATALWALTGRTKIMHWRGSIMQGDGGRKVLALLHPAAVMRMWGLRPITVNDLRRVRQESLSPTIEKPDWRFQIDPTYAEVLATLDQLQAAVEAGPLWLDFDLETGAGHIKCAGLSWSRLDAICIPFMRQSGGRYVDAWGEEAEAEIVWRLYQLMTHPNCWVRGQNLLYDSQYTWRHWHFCPNVKQDTMIAQHTAFAGLKKSLDYLASMYCRNYQQWKPEKGGGWKEGG
jgi:uracil-DNA glycosylase